MNKIIVLIFLFTCSVFADKIYSKNKKANMLFEKEKYKEALSIYRDALLESPGNEKLAMNKGSAEYKTGDFIEAEESYKSALSIKENNAKADLFFNLGNTLNKKGDQLASTGNQQVMEAYELAKKSYIQSLDLRPNDMDAKWNLEITQKKIEQLKKQKQQQKQKKQNNKKDQNKKENEKNKQQDKEQDKEKDQNQQNQGQKDSEQNNQNRDKEQEKQPKPEKPEKDIKKDEAMRLLKQYADDAKDLNKPKKKAVIAKGKKPEKDW